MRGFPMISAMAAVLLAAGCGERRDADRGGNDQAAATNGTEAAAPAAQAADTANSSGPAAPAPPATGKTIPATVLGVYDASLEACGKPSDTRLTVSPTELRFHESIGTVRRATVTGVDTVTVEADYQGEGESWRSNRELRLGEGGATLTISGDGTRLVRVRCPSVAR